MGEPCGAGRDGVHGEEDGNSKLMGNNKLGEHESGR
jgi:hypothetical protein